MKQKIGRGEGLSLVFLSLSLLLPLSNTPLYTHPHKPGSSTYALNALTGSPHLTCEITVTWKTIFFVFCTTTLTI